MRSCVPQRKSVAGLSQFPSVVAVPADKGEACKSEKPKVPYPKLARTPLLSDAEKAADGKEKTEKGRTNGREEQKKRKVEKEKHENMR